MLKSILDVFSFHQQLSPRFSGWGSGVSDFRAPSANSLSTTLDLTDSLTFRVNHHDPFKRMIKKSTKSELATLKKRLAKVKEDQRALAEVRKRKPTESTIKFVTAKLAKAAKRIAKL